MTPLEWIEDLGATYIGYCLVAAFVLTARIGWRPKRLWIMAASAIGTIVVIPLVPVALIIRPDLIMGHWVEALAPRQDP